MIKKKRSMKGQCERVVIVIIEKKLHAESFGKGVLRMDWGCQCTKLGLQ
jgi:hypothetical protein